MSTAASALRQVTEPAALRAWVADERRAGRRLAFVPTMGYLHDGHVELVRVARRHADRVVVSIFVNPLQFGPGEDLDRYPRDLERDLAMLDGLADVVFVPAADALYPPGSEVRVVPGPTAERWEGAARPGHFTGVLTVVAKLFNLVQPDVACFGQKDWQQVVLVRAMVRDLDVPVSLVVVPTVREADGLALSSRNVYLSAEDRAEALALSRGLAAAHERFMAGERDAARVHDAVRDAIAVHPRVSAEYIAVVDPHTLEPEIRVSAASVVAVAARVGRTRLIDNIVLGDGLVPGRTA